MRQSVLVLLFPAAIAGLIGPVVYAADIPLSCPIEERKISSDTDRSIRVTATANLSGLESPAGFEHLRNPVRSPREGYLLRYTDSGGVTREVFNYADIYSNTLSSAGPDIVPESFSGTASGSRVGVGSPATAVVTVRTRDNQLRLQHTFQWTAGLSLTVSVKIMNISGGNVTLLQFARVADLNTSAGGTYGTRELVNSFVAIAGGAASFDVRCRTGVCPPPCDPTDPGCDPLKFVSQLAVGMTGFPAPTSVLVKNMASVSSAFEPFTSRIDDIDGAVMLQWSGKKSLGTTAATSSITYEITYLAR